MGSDEVVLSEVRGVYPLGGLYNILDSVTSICRGFVVATTCCGLVADLSKRFGFAVDLSYNLCKNSADLLYNLYN